MAKRKVTYEIDEELARGVKFAAVAENKPEYVVVEDALKRHLLKPLLDKVWSETDQMDPDEAMDLAVREVKAARANRSRPKKPPAEGEHGPA